jgi:hypothetical protein
MHGSMCPLLPGWEVNLCYAGLYGLLLLGPVDLVPTVGQELAAQHSHQVGTISGAQLSCAFSGFSEHSFQFTTGR